METTQSGSVKCSCNNCSEHLQFELQDAGKRIDCPHCGMETLLYVPQKYVASVKQAPTTPAPAPQKPAAASQPAPQTDLRTRSSMAGAVSMVFLSIIGAALIFNGCTLHTESAIHQIYAAIQYCTGFMLIGIAMLINSVVGPRR